MAKVSTATSPIGVAIRVPARKQTKGNAVKIGPRLPLLYIGKLSEEAKMSARSLKQHLAVQIGAGRRLDQRGRLKRQM